MPPLGPIRKGKDVQFSVFSSIATKAILQLFHAPDSAAPSREIQLKPYKHAHGKIWRTTAKNILNGQLYAYRMEGPFSPSTDGTRTHNSQLLMDPYARAIVGPGPEMEAKALGFDPASPDTDLVPPPTDTAPFVPKCVFVDTTKPKTGPKPPRIPWRNTVVYEAHVRGFTRHESSGVKSPGTFSALKEKIPYLKNLGITTIELLPVQDAPLIQHNKAAEGREGGKINYWGYNTRSFFALNPRYCANANPAKAHAEFRSLVQSIHEAGMEIILDVVFNHTAESGEIGYTYSFKGIDNPAYYMLENSRYYRNFSGCGNTFNCNHPAVQDLILDSLRFWAEDMLVDGFRFDLAAVFARDAAGDVISDPPILRRIAGDPILKHVKLIAEPWDAAGLNLQGNFPGLAWREWNGRFRDDIREFWQGPNPSLSRLASRICGSADLFQQDAKTPLHSINFITCHDGFTLADLVSFERKHNEANGEENRDGANHNFSRNFGEEGPSFDLKVLAIRERQMRNLLATLMISQGIPMIQAGDEFHRTQQGNNNAYCQDSEISWINWEQAKRNRSFIAFCRRLIAFRRNHPVLQSPNYFREIAGKKDVFPRIEWYDSSLKPPQWGNPAQESLGFRLCAAGKPNDLLVVLNRGPGFNQQIPKGNWSRAIDTFLPNNEAVLIDGKEVAVQGDAYFVNPLSLVVLIQRR